MHLAAIFLTGGTETTEKADQRGSRHDFDALKIDAGQQDPWAQTNRAEASTIVAIFAKQKEVGLHAE